MWSLSLPFPVIALPHLPWVVPAAAEHPPPHPPPAISPRPDPAEERRVLAGGWLGCVWQIAVVWGDISDDAARTDCGRFWLRSAAKRHLRVLVCVGLGALLSWGPPLVHERGSHLVVVALVSHAVTEVADDHPRGRRVALGGALLAYQLVLTPWPWLQMVGVGLAVDSRAAGRTSYECGRFVASRHRADDQVLDAAPPATAPVTTSPATTNPEQPAVVSDVASEPVVEGSALEIMNDLVSAAPFVTTSP
jgi:hypothetical protein